MAESIVSTGSKAAALQKRVQTRPVGLAVDKARTIHWWARGPQPGLGWWKRPGWEPGAAQAQADGPLAAAVRESAATPNTMPTRHAQPATSYQNSLEPDGFCVQQGTWVELEMGRKLKFRGVTLPMICSKQGLPPVCSSEKQHGQAGQHQWRTAAGHARARCTAGAQPAAHLLACRTRLCGTRRGLGRACRLQLPLQLVVQLQASRAGRGRRGQVGAGTRCLRPAAGAPKKAWQAGHGA